MRIRWISTVALVVIVALSAWACGSSSNGEPSDATANPLASIRWRVERLADEAGQTSSVEGVDVFLVFIEGRVAGFSGCNDFGGSVEVDEDRVVVAGLAGDAQACAPDVMAQERLLYTNLGQVTMWEIDDSHLTLLGPDGPLVELRDWSWNSMTISGVVTAGPTCPVERDPPDPSCEPRPVTGADLQLTTIGGTAVIRATTDPEGRFELPAEPGRYVLVAEPVAGLLGVPEPVEIVVTTRSVSVDLIYDTGIR